jgi:hypothetical protein
MNRTSENLTTKLTEEEKLSKEDAELMTRYAFENHLDKNRRAE